MTGRPRGIDALVRGAVLVFMIGAVALLALLAAAADRDVPAGSGLIVTTVLGLGFALGLAAIVLSSRRRRSGGDGRADES